MKPSEYLGMVWPPAIMPVNAQSVNDMLRVEQNQQWLLKHAAVYDRRAWSFLGISGLLLLLTPLALALFIPALHIRFQVWRMLRYVRREQGATSSKKKD
jgi:hypothetical protein